jgi:hypothetical protein
MKEKINIIHDKETELFFKRIGLLEKILKHEIKCVFCQDTITLTNFRGAFKKDNNLFLVCNKEDCFSFHMTQKLEEGTNG